MLAVWLSWAEAHADALKRPAAIGTVASLTELLPCTAEVTPQ